MTGRVLVIGFGVTGRAVVSCLSDRFESVLVVEDNAAIPPEEAARFPSASFVPSPSAPAEAAQLVKAVDLVVPSPGVPPSHPVVAEALRLGVAVRSEVDLAAEEAQRLGLPVAAITGTNGKTTVTTLVRAALEEAGLKAVAAGNIGRPMVEALGLGADWLVVEVSSFQLYWTQCFKPKVAAWLNFSPDHLDWHRDLDHYRSAKAKVWSNCGPSDSVVYNLDDPVVAQEAALGPAGAIRLPFSATGRQAEPGWRLVGATLLDPFDRVLMQVQELPRAFPHDISNALAAAAVSGAAGASLEACRQALANAPSLEHRVTLVGSDGEVDFYDDSKSTTPASVLAAIEGFGSAVLIAGGRNKGLDLSVLAELVPRLRGVVAIGEASLEIREVFAGEVPVVVAASMREAVRQARSLARPGDAVVLSPGCASFDWYGSYAERGEDFTAEVQALVRQTSRRDPRPPEPVSPGDLLDKGPQP
jgi:UDP-N-acetylmuramoylalanine--D-glutamate ligase